MWTSTPPTEWGSGCGTAIGTGPLKKEKNGENSMSVRFQVIILWLVWELISNLLSNAKIFGEIFFLCI